MLVAFAVVVLLELVLYVLVVMMMMVVVLAELPVRDLLCWLWVPWQLRARQCQA